MNTFEQLFSALDSHLAWVRGLDERGPDAEGNARKYLVYATEAPSSAWALYYAYESFTQAARTASWLFAEPGQAELKEPTNAGLTHIRGIAPSPELDAELQEWQHSHGIQAKAYPAEAPRLTR